MSEKVYLAVSGDKLPRAYGYETGQGHGILVPSGFQEDPLASGATVKRVCGGVAEAKRLTEKFKGDSMCKRCQAKIDDAMIEEGYDNRFSGYDEPEPEPEPTVTEPQGVGALTPAEKGKALADKRREAPRAKMPDTGKPKVEKCAVKGTDKVEAIKDTDHDGVTGQCPVCRSVAKLTGKGFIGAHTVTGEPMPAGTGLKSSTVPPLVTDTAKKREAEAYTVKGRGKNKTVTANVPDAPRAGAAIGQRDHGHMDGPAMLPRGTYANGARPDPKVVKESKAGGTHGWLTYAEVGALSRTRQRKYWREVAKRRDTKRGKH